MKWQPISPMLLIELTTLQNVCDTTPAKCFPHIYEMLNVRLQGNPVEPHSPAQIKPRRLAYREKCRAHVGLHVLVIQRHDLHQVL